MDILSLFSRSGQQNSRRSKSRFQKRRVLIEALERRYCFDAAPIAIGEGTVTGPYMPGYEQGVAIDLAANDFDVDGDLNYNAIVLDIVTGPTNGTLNLSNSASLGAVTYIPNPGFGHNQVDQFSYRIQDLAGNWSNTAVATIAVDPNPEAFDVFYNTKFDTPATIDPSTSDVYWYVDPASTTVIDLPALGFVEVLEDGRFYYEYTAEPLLPGDALLDSFTYQVADENGDLSNVATVFVTIFGNNAPVAIDDLVRMRVGEAGVFVNVLSNDFDNDPHDFPDPSTLQILSSPSNGSFTLTELGELFYAPAPGFIGTDTITYVVADTSLVYSAPATLTIFVQPAPAIIDNGLIQLGINQEGHLNVSEGSEPSDAATEATGLRYMPTNFDSTAPGCLCEGWGVADADTNLAGYANISSDQGTRGMRFVNFESTPYSAVSVVDVDGKTGITQGGGGGGGGETPSSLLATSSSFTPSSILSEQLIRVTHDYHPTALTPNLYEVTVTIENLSALPINDLRYRRVMDWDIEPTAFSEFVTIQGFGEENPNLLFSSDDGFASANPLGARSSINAIENFVDSGPNDHGALFDFGNFGVIAPGGKTAFNIYYGAAENQVEALEAISAVNARVYSIAKSSVDVETGTPNTFIFAFGNLRTNVENNIAPVAENDQLNTKYETPTTVHASVLLANDYDPDGDTVSLRIESVDSSSENGGTITVNPQTFQIEYTPPTGFRGVDSFKYILSDGLASDEAVVYVNVGAPTVTKVLALYGGAAGAPATRTFEITPSTRVLPWAIKGVEIQFDQVVTGADPLDFFGGSFSSVSNTTGSALRWTFTNTMLVGAFNLSLRSGPGGIFGADGLLLDGNKDGVGGDAFAFSFRSLEGDFDGNGIVENVDVTRVLLSRGSSNMFADIDGDGDVDNDDVNRARSRLRNRLPLLT